MVKKLFFLLHSSICNCYEGNLKRLLLLRNVNASWAIRDLELLQPHFQVADQFVEPRFYFHWKWIWQVYKTDIVYCWFASFQFLPAVLLAKILRKKVIIVSGGYDAAFAPAVNYGAFCAGKLSQSLRRFLFSMADRVLCVSQSNLRETIENAKVKKARCRLVYHGFEPLPDGFALRSWPERKNRVVMISQCDDSTYRKKGIDHFVRLASLLPSYEFVLMGKVTPPLEERLKNEAPPNFRHTGFLKFRGDEFFKILNDSKFIAQLSYHESFGCAVIDAAILGCYPLTTKQFSLPEINEGLGTSVEYSDLQGLKDVILQVTSSHMDTSEISRRALTRFPLDQRQNGLLSALGEIDPK